MQGHCEYFALHALIRTWCSNDNVRMARKQPLLFLHGHAADDGGAFEAGVGGELPEE
jgi:hypothetical protein